MQLVKRLLLLGVTLLMLLALGEIGLRLFSRTVPPLVEKDPLIGQRYLRSFSAEIYVPEAQRVVAVRFNSQGFRGPDRPREKPGNARRVAVLGDSMIASLGVNEQDTFVCRLEELLRRSHPQWQWEVLNYGVSGASPGQELALYRELVHQWRPDIVLGCFFTGNDLADNCRRLSNNPRIYFDLDEHGQLQQLPYSAERAAVSAWLNRHSRLYVWQRELVNAARHRVLENVGTLEPGQKIFSTQESDDLAYAWRLSAAIQAELQRQVTAHGAQFAVILLPCNFQVYRDSFEKLRTLAGPLGPHFDADHPDRRLGQLCREANIPFVSLSKDFRAAAPAGKSDVREQWLFHQGFGHFNEQGNALAAQVVHRFLTQGEPGAAPPLVNQLR